MVLLLSTDEHLFNEFMRSFARMNNDLQTIKELLMTIDPNVQKVSDDVNAMAVALQEVIGALTGAEGQILTLTNEVATLKQTASQGGTISPDNLAALSTAATALEASIASAKAAAAPSAPAAPAAAPADATAAPAATSQAAP